MGISLPDDVVTLLTAPSFVRFEDDGLLYLDHGSAWIEVGKKGRGFRVRTAGIDSTDLGTSFGVIVPSPGSEDSEVVRVGKGKVNVLSKSAPDETERLKTSQSVRLMPDGRLARIPSGMAAFRKAFDSGILAQYSFDDADVFSRGAPSMGIRGKGGSHSIPLPLMFGPGFSSPESAVASLTAPENFRFAANSFSPQRIVLEKDKFRNLSRITFRIYVEDGGGQTFSAGANFGNILVLGTVSPAEE